MKLLETFLDVLSPWAEVFPQKRTARRAVAHAVGTLAAFGRRTLSRVIWANGGQHRSWSAHYHLYSRCRWHTERLFDPILRQALAFCPGRLIGVAIDDTRLHKTGRCIVQAFYQRDPLSPPFHLNLVLGLRFLQASLLLPLHRRASLGCRGLPIRFEEVSRVKRPRKKAPVEQWQQYRQDCRRYNLSQRFVGMMNELRANFDQAGARRQTLVLAVDGSFCNRTVLRAVVDRVEVIARARKDAVLCFRAPTGGRRVYDTHKFTPEQVRHDDSLPWQTTKIFYGNKRYKVRYKDITAVLWRGGAGPRPVRLFVVAPTRYRKRNSGRYYYRNPAYLLCTDLHSRAKPLLQIYFDRWQIEVNHREEKDTLGVGQAQMWNPIAVPKQPALAVAAYSALLLASLLAYGPHRGETYEMLPKWRRSARRPSGLDLVTQLRKEMVEHPELLSKLGIQTSFDALAKAAAA
jgi:DDE superfamily endonuclease